MGKFDWGVCYVIILLYAQLWLQLAAVSYMVRKFEPWPPCGEVGK